MSGQVFVSSGGNLKCKNIIHAVGPRWMGGHKNEEEDLLEAVCNSLLEADKHKFVSIGVPPISAGIFGFPLNKCVEIIVNVIHNYLSKTPKTSLRKIYLVSINQNEVNELSKELQRQFRSK